MPPVIVAFAAWAGISVAAAYLVAATVVLSAGMAVYGSAQARRAERDAKNQALAAMKDRMVTRIATESPHRHIYGRAKVGADIVAMFTTGDRDQFKHLVCVHAAHECDAIEEVWVNNALVEQLDLAGDPTAGRFAVTPDSEILEEQVVGPTFYLSRTPRAGSIWVFSGIGAAMQPVAITATNGRQITVAQSGPLTVSYEVPLRKKMNDGVTDPNEELSNILNPVVRVRKHLGTPNDPVDANLHAALGDRWPSTAVLRGLCYTIITLDLNHPEFQSGIPPIHAVIRGKKLYDPRDGQTRWSQNPALVIRDYLTGPLCGVPAADLPTAQFITAANVCDEASPTGGARYTINGTVTSDQGQASVLESMTQAMAGGLVATTWDVYAGKYVAPVAALVQSDIVGGLSVTPGVSDASVYNGVKGQYIGPENKYVQTDFAPYQNSAYRANDGRDLYTNIDFPFTDSLQRVTNLARIFVEDQRNGFTIRAEFSLKAWPLKVGQRLTFTSAVLGHNAKVFRITDKSYSPTSAVQLTLKEDAASIWDYADSTVVDSTPNTDLPDPWKIDAPASLSCTSGEAALLRQADGTTVPRIMASWPAMTQPNGVQVEVEWRAIQSTTWERTTVSASETRAYLSPITPGFFYVVRARTVNPSLNIHSNAVATIYQVEVFKASATVYMWSTDMPAPPTGAGAYLWSNGTFGAAPAGWSLTEQPAPVTGNTTQWAAVVPLSDITDAGTTPFDWSTAAIVNVGYAPSAAGQGPAGYSNVTVAAYQRKATAPTGTPGAVNVDLTTGKITTATLANGWLKDMPTDDGNPLYATYGSASGTGTADAIAANEWTGAIVLVRSGAQGPQGPQGPQGNQGVQGPIGPNGAPTYTWIKYSDNADGTGLYDTPTPSTLYIGIAVNKSAQAESAVKTDYVWSRFRGDQGVQGPTGPNGQPTYTWVKYADNASGAGLTDNPAGKLYIGLAYNKATDVESTTPGDYMWSLIKGDQGAAGLNNATVRIYQRSNSATAPALPTADVTYAFANGAVTGLNNNWFAYIPTAGGAYLHTSLATAAAVTATDTIPPGEWAASQLMYDAADLIAAKAAADAANARIANISANGVLDRSEKPAINAEWNAINKKATLLEIHADSMGVSRATLSAKFGELTSYLQALVPQWNDATQDTNIVRADFDAKFNNYYESEVALLNAIAAKIQSNAALAGAKADASGGLTLIGRGIAVLGNSATKETGTTGFNADCYSKEAYSGGCFASVVPVDTSVSTDLMFGLNEDPVGDNGWGVGGWQGLNYALRLQNSGAITCFEGSVEVGQLGLFVYGDILSIEYDEVEVRYKKNGLLLRSVSAPAGWRFYFDSTFYTVGSKLTRIIFAPFGSGAAVVAAKAAADAAQADATAAKTSLSRISADNWLAAQEKPVVILEWKRIADERSGIVAQAANLGIGAEKTAYQSAYDSLSSYLPATWNDLTVDTAIVRTVFDQKFADYYAARQYLLNTITAVLQYNAAQAATTSTWAGTSGAGKPADYATVGAPPGTNVGNTPATTVEANANSAVKVPTFTLTGTFDGTASTPATTMQTLSRALFATVSGNANPVTITWEATNVDATVPIRMTSNTGPNVTVSATAGNTAILIAIKCTATDAVTGQSLVRTGLVNLRFGNV